MALCRPDARCNGTVVEFAFRTGYDGLGRVSVHHVVERGCAAMLTRPEAAAV